MLGVMSNVSGFGVGAGTSLGDSITLGTGTERAPSGLARFFGTNPLQDRGNL
jgi:hypothetical protein